MAGNVIRGSLGNLIEWYDWYAYAAFSIYFAGVFFPSGNPTAQLLNTAGIFAVGFLMRPIGGWLFGRYADRYGRRAALTLSVTVMGVGSLGIAVPARVRPDRRTGAGLCWSPRGCCKGCRSVVSTERPQRISARSPPRTAAASTPRSST